MPKIELQCGKETCYNTEKHTNCVMLQTGRFGTAFICGYFLKELADRNGVLSGPGLLRRLPECLKATTD